MHYYKCITLSLTPLFVLLFAGAFGTYKKHYPPGCLGLSRAFQNFLWHYASSWYWSFTV